MQNKYIIKSANIVNENKIYISDILIKNSRIEKIAYDITDTDAIIINAEGKYLFPGIIDDQVHFREPGLIHKADIYSESRAAAAGGVTSFMEMPNTIPNAVNPELLEKKYDIAAENSLVNYSFYIGVAKSEWEKALKADFSKVCGIKVFLGSSTGDMCVDDEQIIRQVFSSTDALIAVHSEDDNIIKENLELIKAKYNGVLPPSAHPEIRDEKACYEMTKFIVGVAKSTGGRLHVLHLSTDDEMEFFTSDLPLESKKITAEVCVHHLYFDSSDYAKYGNLIKCNPSIKDSRHKSKLLEALLSNKIDVVATDHAPHTWDEKFQAYINAPSGIPLVSHPLNIMLELHKSGKISLTQIVEKMCHNPARLFRIKERGYIREGYYADLTILDLDEQWKVEKSNILYKCKWSPFEGYTFTGRVTHTFVNGNIVYQNGKLIEHSRGERLLFHST
jgi:dihydroorotase